MFAWIMTWLRDLDIANVLLSVIMGVALSIVLVLLVKSQLYQQDDTINSGLHGDSIPEQEKDKDRRFGEWTPKQFAYPPIKPCCTPLTEIKPIPYRPFRWGPYHVTMGIRSMPWDDWIELDNQYERYFRIRRHRIKTRGKRAVRVLDEKATSGVAGGELAAVELVHELSEYLSRRYPITFHVTRHDPTVSSDWGWEGLPSIRSITIIPLGVSYELPLSTNQANYEPVTAAERAMEIAALLVQDDLALMIEGEDGKYYFQAGAICVPGFWRMEDKIGLSLDEIHTSGGVPQYQEKLQASMNRFFRRMTVDRAVVRNNYFIQVVRERSGDSAKGEQSEAEKEREAEADEEELAWSTSANGSEDRFTHAHGFEDASVRAAITAERLRLRTERQTLRRLPRSGAVIFTIRTYLVGMVELGQEEGVGGRLVSAVRGWPLDVAEYKGVNRGGWWSVLMGVYDAKMTSTKGNKEAGTDDQTATNRI